MDENFLGNIVSGLVQKDGAMGNNGTWIILLFFLFWMFGGNGWNRNNCATQQDVAGAFNFNQLDNGIRSLGNGMASLGYDGMAQTNGTNMMIQGGFANLAQALAENRFASQQCCCETNRNIDAVRYDNAQQTTAIVTNDTANTQKILDKLCQMEASAKDNTIAQLRADLQSAQLTLSNAAQTQNIVGALRPTPVPAYITASPYASYYGGTIVS